MARSVHAPARCVLGEGEHLGCSTRRWEERLVLSPRLYREARQHPDLAQLLRQLHRAHDERLPPVVWIGFELGSSVRSEALGVELCGISHCRSKAPAWAPRTKRTTPGCRLYTYFAFREEI
jgi:hypothetical protein